MQETPAPPPEPPRPPPGDTNPAAARLASFTHAVRGLRHLLATQPNARIHLAATVLVALAATALGLPADEWCWVVAAVAAVWVAEAFNTALESLADAVHPDPHPLVGTAKDCAAAAVLLASAGAAAVGLIVFAPRLWS